MALRALLLPLLAALTFLSAAAPVGAAEEAVEPPARYWRFDGVFGTWDLPSIRRGLHVYEEVCSTCHSLGLVSYHSLALIGLSDDEITAIAGRRQVPALPDEQGVVGMRRAVASDRFVAPFPNEQAARFNNNGALPPDLSVMPLAREGGPDHIHAFLTGFAEPPPGVDLMPGMYWNPWFPGHQTAMPDVLSDGGITYADGTVATKEQQATDVVNFLMWTADPHLAERKKMGVKVFLFILVFTGMMYAVKRRIWARIH